MANLSFVTETNFALLQLAEMKHIILNICSKWKETINSEKTCIALEMPEWD